MQRPWGCPHRCTYCGQRLFWRQWRCRDPARVADDVESLYREHGVRFLHLADDDPAADQAAGLRFHTRPGKLWRLLRTRDPLYRRELLCVLRHTTPVWFAELAASMWWALFRCGR